MRKFFSLILILIFIASSQAQSTDLTLKLEKGNEYKQIASSKVSIIQDINGQEMNIVATISGTMSFHVKSINENGFGMDVKYEKLSMSMQMPQGIMEFSSEKKDENDVLSMILGAMKNQTFRLTMSKTGKIDDVKNVETLWETVINKFDQLSEIQKEQVKAQMMKAYGAKSLKGNIEMTTAIYPEKPVNKGDKWTINTNIESGMSSKLSTEYEFVDLTFDYALIKGNSTIETADKDAYIESNGTPMKYDLLGSMLSEIKVDKNTGWIIEAKIYQEIKGVAYVKENTQMPNGMKIPMTMINEMVITN